jgi:replicative DNA helicase
VSAEQPFQALDAERAVIGALLIATDRICDARELLASDDFTTCSLRVVWDALCKLDAERIPIDRLALCNALKANGTWEVAGNQAALIELMHDVTSAARLPYFCRVVAETSTLRRVASVCRDAAIEAGQIRPGVNEVDAFVESTERSLHAVSARSFQAAQALTVAESLPGVVYTLTDTTEAPGLATGLADLDERLRGIRRGELIVIAARPGEGKSALAGQIAINAARAGRCVLFISLEMSRESLIQRFLCNVGSIDSGTMRDRRFASPHQRERLERAKAGLAEFASLITIDERGTSTLMRIRALARRQASRGALDVVIVDYLQLLHEPGIKNRWEEVGFVSRGLKALAKEFQVPVIALAQLKREAVTEDRPHLHHLRESGSIEQDADAVALLWGGDMEADVIELNCDVEKNRHGRRGMLKLSFNRPYFRFTDTTVAREVIFDQSSASGGAD